MKRGKAYTLLIVILAVLFGLGYIAINGIGSDRQGSLSTIGLGLDLSGGVSITYAVVNEDATAEDVSDTVAKLQRRVEQYSTEATVYTSGENRITIEIPGVSDADEILQEIGQPGNLYFIKQKDPEGNDNYGDYTINNAGELIEVLKNKTIEDCIADGSVVLSGTDVVSAELGSQQDKFGAQQFVVSLRFTEEGTKKFAEATQYAFDNGESIGIYYDGVMVSTPNVNAAILDGQAIIEGNFTAESASQLATTIRIGGLKVQLEELRSNVVGARLGQDAIQTSLKAAIVGFAIVVLFMIVLYRVLGLAAGMALTAYVFLIIIFLDGLEITLTLPGIAGIILSIGMAVDANVLVFSRIREEITAGKTVQEAMKSGYHKALSAILDGNITTMIAALVLMLLTSGSIKGFAYTLALGICLSMVTALFITRVISAVLYGCGFQDEKYYGRAGERKLLPIIEKRKLSYIVAIVAICVGFAAMGINGASGKGALNLSLDFAGGTQTTVTFDKQYTLAELDNEIVPKLRDAAGISSMQSTVVRDANQVIFKSVTLSAEQRAAINDVLEADYGVTAENIETESISSTISSEMGRSAFIALIVALVLMLIYIRIRFRDIRFGLSSIAALSHDALLVLACYALTRIEVGSTFIAAVLTIIGYSINNTIVVFDRLRERLKLGASSKESTGELVDQGVTDTLSRSLFTSLTTFIMVLALYVFGVNDIRNFALPLMTGIACGTFSSVLLASPLWYDMKNRKKADKA